MPEGPEIRQAADWLARFVGGTITGVSGRLRNPAAPRLFPATVVGARSHGKLLWLECRDADGAPLAVVFKLNLTGALSTQVAAHTRTEVAFARPLLSLQFADPSGFGWVDVDPDMGRLNAARAALGVDPLDRAVTPADLAVFAAGGRGKSVAARLLDQNKVAGIGNYLRAEIVFAAGLSCAEWRGTGLAPDALAALAAAINRIFRAAYEDGDTYAMACYRVPGMESSPEGGRPFYHAPC